MMPTVAEISTRVDRLENDIRELSQNHNELSDKIVRLDAKMDVYNNDLKSVRDKITEVAQDVKTIMLKPAKRFDNISQQVIFIVLGLIIGFVFNHFINN